MKLEIEITEDEIRSAVENKIRTALVVQSTSWSAEEYIKEQVKTQWKSAVDQLVLDALRNSQLLREKIAVEIERKLRAQITAAIKAAG